MDVLLPLLAGGELDEEVSEAWVAKKSFFGFFAVLIHSISNQIEIHQSALDDIFDIFFLEVVTQNDGQEG